jgi:hypothetical protein
MAVRLSALRSGRPLSPGRFLVLISVRGWIDLRAIKEYCLLWCDAVLFSISLPTFRRNTRLPFSRQASSGGLHNGDNEECCLVMWPVEVYRRFEGTYRSVTHWTSNKQVASTEHTLLRTSHLVSWKPTNFTFNTFRGENNKGISYMLNFVQRSNSIDEDTDGTEHVACVCRGGSFTTLSRI